jgi:hypothetical protein
VRIGDVILTSGNDSMKSIYKLKILSMGFFQEEIGIELRASYVAGVSGRHLPPYPAFH